MLKNLIKLDTCQTYNRDSSAIDHFCTNNMEQHDICPHDVTDHDIVFASRKKIKIKWDKIKIVARRYSRLNEDLFAADINDFDWDIVYTCNDVDVAWDTFVRIFNSILDRHALWRTMTFKDHIPEWCTKEFISMCKEHDYVKARYERLKSEIEQWTWVGNCVKITLKMD